MGQRFVGWISEEYERTVRWVLRVTDQQRLMGHAAVVRSTVELRNPAVLPLSLLQSALLREYDAFGEDAASDPRTAGLREAILLSITGIAAAMQSTG